MDTDRIHRAVSDDGTEIAARVVGQGPPLVFVHGAVADGALEWDALVPHLRDRFTCYVMDTRCRGLSGHASDLTPEQLVADVTAIADSVGEPVGLVGVSGGGMLVLGAAARTSAVAAVAAYEPVVFEVISEEDATTFQQTVASMEEAAAQGRLDEAARIFLDPILNDDERELLTADYLEAAGRCVPVDLREIRQASETGGYSPTDPSVLADITAPVLVLWGGDTALRAWFADCVRHVADHVADARVCELPAAGHLGPSLHPHTVAGELTAFFAAAPAPA